MRGDSDETDVWFAAAGRSWVGRFRDNNEDSLLACPVAVAVADGVGGQEAGELASAVVIEKLAASLLTNRRVDEPELVRELVGGANAEISVRLDHDLRLDGMATTLTALFAGRGRVLLAQVGDSRAYLLRAGKGFTQISRDDSLVQKLVDDGLLSEEQAGIHPYRSVVLRVLGGRESDVLETTITEHDVVAGDRWLLASDGLTDYVPRPIIAEILDGAGTPDEITQRLIDAADSAESRDNVSVVVCDLTAIPTETPVVVYGSALDLFGLT